MGQEREPSEAQRAWQGPPGEGTVPEDFGAGLAPAAFSSRGRGWKKVYTKSHWNRIRTQTLLQEDSNRREDGFRGRV